MENRRLRSYCCQDGKVRKVCRTHPATSQGTSEVEVLHVHPKHLEEVLRTSPQPKHSWKQSRSVEEEDDHRHDVQQLPLQKLRDTAGKRNSLHQHLPVRLGESAKSDRGSQQHLTRRRSLPDLRKPDEVCKAVRRSSEGI